MAVAKRKNEVLAPPGVTNIPVYLKDMQGSRGSEEVESDDLIIPRLEVCQALSWCLKKKDPAYIDGIEEGMLYNNVTREIYGHNVVVCPVMFKKEYLLWRERKDGGGFYGAYSSFEEAEEKRASLERPEKVEAVDTHQHLCLLVSDEGGLQDLQEIAISMAKSKRKPSKAWNSLIRINGGDRFSRLYTVSSVADNNGQDDYRNLKITNCGFVTESTYSAGVKLYDAIKAGVVSVDRSLDDEQAVADVHGDSTGY